MSVLLQLNNIDKQYGHISILEKASASFSKYQKIGVIGRNGAGKSTLCKIIIGQEEMDGGTISRNSELRLNYLEQHDPYQEKETVLDFLTRYTGKEAWECGEIAGRFQLKNELLEAEISSLPGGYRTRVKLAAMLLGDPNFLILDEPTNYLDLSTLILLENFLSDFNGGFLIVSHDREFLKRTCDHTLEVENGRLTLYPGGIEDYFLFKEEQLEHKMAYNKTIEKKKEQLQAFVDRFKAKASTASRAKSKMKQIHKLKAIEIEHPLDHVHIRIPFVENKTGVALFCQELEIGYPEKKVASGIYFDINRGSHVAVLGNNGEGKTTFLRTVAGDLVPRSGNYRWGTGLKVAYYAQHVLSMLDVQDDVYAHLQRQAAAGITNQEILNMAGSFLFKGDDVRKKIAVLSGGERARLCLAGLLLTKSQVLLLDEPTNHLDFETVEALAGALRQFAGTVLFISHDRTFVNLVATSILEVKDGRVSKYPGSYEEYVYHLETLTEDEFFSDGRTARTKKPHSHKKHVPSEEELLPPEDKSPAEDSSKLETKTIEEITHESKKNKSAAVKLKNEIRKVESRMEHLTKERNDLLEEIKRNPFHYSRQRNERLKVLGVTLAADEKLWFDLQAQLEGLNQNRVF